MHENDFFNEDLLCALAGVAGEDNVLMSEPMREHTTFKIGGPADVFVTPDTEQGLVATLDTCYRCDLPLTIVGNGSDLLVGDKGIRGVVVALGEGLSNITVNGTHVTAAAGALLSDVAAAAAEAGLTGMEPISGIPGSVGGACYMNAGAYGACMADVLESVRVYKPARMLDDGTRGSGNIIEFDVDELNLGYRKSRIADDGFIVLSATFNLAPGNAAMIKADMDDYRQRRVGQAAARHAECRLHLQAPRGLLCRQAHHGCRTARPCCRRRAGKRKALRFYRQRRPRHRRRCRRTHPPHPNNRQRPIQRRPRTRSPPSRRIPLTKKAPKGAFTIFIQITQSGVSRSGPERAACPPAIYLIDREFRTQRRPLNVAFVLRRTARAGNQIYCGRARGPTYVTTAPRRQASPNARQSQCHRS